MLAGRHRAAPFAAGRVMTSGDSCQVSIETGRLSSREREWRQPVKVTDCRRGLSEVTWLPDL